MHPVANRQEGEFRRGPAGCTPGGLGARRASGAADPIGRPGALDLAAGNSRRTGSFRGEPARMCAQIEAIRRTPGRTRSFRGGALTRVRRSDSPRSWPSDDSYV
jgi:hypothetical protein